jgi:hypothetical protein
MGADWSARLAYALTRGLLALPRMPSPADIAAYIGAAAWLPQIGSWIYDRYVPPVVRIIPERQVQLGYTTLGPIFNVRLALVADRKDAIVEHMEARVRHEQGDVHTFTWTGLREMFSEITDSAGNRGVVERDQPAIALKVSTALPVEKFVRFQDVAYHDRHRVPMESLVAQFNYAKANYPDFRERILQSKEYHSLLEFYRAEFWWKPGKYTATLSIQSSSRARLRSDTFGFQIAQYDVDAMRGNLDVMNAEYRNTIMMGADGYEPSPIAWAWRTLPLNPMRTGIPARAAV